MLVVAVPAAAAAGVLAAAAAGVRAQPVPARGSARLQDMIEYNSAEGMKT